IAEFVGWPMALLSLECPVSCAKTLGNAPERAVTTRQEAWMPLQATAQSEKLIFRPCRRASLAHLAGTDVPSDTARSAILTHRFCHTAENGKNERNGRGWGEAMAYKTFTTFRCQRRRAYGI